MSSPGLFGNVENNAAGTGGSEPQKASGSASQATQSLYRKFRPQTFDVDELVGQDAIVRTLKNAIQLDRVAHAYLFAGPRGTGKTTTARLLAKAVNCLDPDMAARPCNRCAACLAISSGSAIDVVEIDAASNRGIDDIRELRERVRFAPAQLKTKFYIIDEAHQITGAAANAFLKTLEEPPSHTRFVLATTDPEQILPTIVSRCQIFEFKRIPPEAAKRRVAIVAAQEGLSIAPEALDLIVRQSGGSLRDALGLVDQLAAYRQADGGDTPITVDDVRELLGLSRDELVVQIVVAIAEREAATALGLLQDAVDRGADPRQIARQIVQFLRAIMHALADPATAADSEVERVSKMFSLGEVMSEAQRYSELDFKVRHSAIPQLPIEIAIVASVLREGAAGPTQTVVRQHPERPNEAAEDSAMQQVGADPAPVQRSAGSLADRVRKTPTAESRLRPNPSQASASQAPESRQEVAPVQHETTVQPGSLTIDLIHSQWEQIRADVKARSRRVDALLVSVDPVAVQGDTVILASAYPFHRNKLSEPEVQAVVEDVIGRLAGRRVIVSTVMHDEAPRYKSTSAAASPAAVSSDGSASGFIAESPPEQTNGQISDKERAVLEAAKNIFDAEEVDP